MGSVDILIGAQWGDEGKGRWIDILAHEADIVARFQGGTNAGHTLYVNGKKIVLHQIPSGIFQPKQICALTAGVVVSPAAFLDEFEKVGKLVEIQPERLWVSARCHVITPWHIYQDSQAEEKSKNPIGTTKRGIGPTYSDKASRRGLRLGHYVDSESRKHWLSSMAGSCADFAAHLENNQEAWNKFEAAAAAIRPFVTDAETRIRSALASGKKLLMEGAQGALLDIDHGTYPYVTSSSTCTGGGLASLGFSPKAVNKIYGVAKAYLTRVGEGPFPTELQDEVGSFLRKQGNEFGATTGRPRRCGWLDMVALRYAAQVNGMDAFILNKFDVLSGLAEIKICTSYQHPTLGEIKDFPWDYKILQDCKPNLVSFKGWGDISSCKTFADLPTSAKDYVVGVEKSLGLPVAMIGTGVNRADAIFR